MVTKQDFMHILQGTDREELSLLWTAFQKDPELVLVTLIQERHAADILRVAIENQKKANRS